MVNCQNFHQVELKVTQATAAHELIRYLWPITAVSASLPGLHNFQSELCQCNAASSIRLVPSMLSIFLVIYGLLTTKKPSVPKGLPGFVIGIF